MRAMLGAASECSDREPELYEFPDGEALRRDLGRGRQDVPSRAGVVLPVRFRLSRRGDQRESHDELVHDRAAEVTGSKDTRGEIH